MKHNVIMLAVAIAMLTAMQTGCTKPDPENVDPQSQAAQATAEPLTSLVGTKWYCHVEEFRQNVPTMGDIHWVCDYWYSFDDENTGTKSGDAKATITPYDGAVTEQEELLTGNFDYSFDPSTGHIFVNNYVVDNHNYPPANYELVYDSETNTLRYVSGNMLDSVYTRVE